MKKDNIRDYATEAFRLYASLGRPTYEELKNKIYNCALEEQKKCEVKTKGLSMPTEQAVLRAQQAVDEMEALLLDVLAVENTLKIIAMRSNGNEILKAVEIVYFTEPDRDIIRGDIQNRVHLAEINIPLGEATVYRYLKMARSIFGEERRLRGNKINIYLI